MRLHRFYTGPELHLGHYVEVREQRLVDQWRKVLRFRVGQEVVLFDGQGHEKLYSLNELAKDHAKLELLTDFVAKLPSKDVYLFWSLLKKDKNDWVMQKATELGVSHLVPVLAERSEKTGFNQERAQKIIIEAAEQCGRGDIPKLRQPLLLQTALHEFAGKVPLFVCEQHELTKPRQPNYSEVGVLIGPEGGWSDQEKQLFVTQEIGRLPLGDFTLRAETAAVAAAAKLLQ
ncbi:MAG: rRNA (uracil1498-N3)-methyltransferase [Patescibacteria group bacterium]|nr:rRNA (uracil1498-N3)-methyltransferase [Patescibacteria group bacterium]